MDGDFNFNIIVVIAFLVIGAIRWVLENIFGKKKPPEPEHWEEYDYEERADQHQPRPLPDSIEDAYEEARRAILERQNRSEPQPEVVAEKLSDYQNAPPPLPASQSAVKAQKVRSVAPSDPVSTQTRPRSLTKEEKQALAAFEAHSEGQPPKQTSRVQSRVRELLASPAAARDAVVLAEILGPPKSTQGSH